MENKELFNAFINKRSDAELFNLIEKLIEKQVRDAVGKENAYFYSVLCKLSNSINNAGWEDRHGDQISLINSVSGKICDAHEEYLP